MFRGTYTALVTPFKNDEIDVEAFERLIEAQIAAGVSGIVPVGTTGESPTLSCGERHHVTELAVERANGRCQVIAGTGSNSTREAIAHTKAAEEIGGWRAARRALLQQAEPGRTLPAFRSDRARDFAQARAL